MERDQTGEYPHDLHAALAMDGWIGIALPEELGGAGLGISEATMMMHTISESGAGMGGAQSIHANVYATQVGLTCPVNLVLGDLPISAGGQIRNKGPAPAHASKTHQRR